MRPSPAIRKNNQKPLLGALTNLKLHPSLFAKNDHKSKLSIKRPLSLLPSPFQGEG